MTIDGNHMTALEGMTFRRIVSGEIIGDDIWLGYSYYIGGVKQDLPHLDVPEDFEEVDIEPITDTEALKIITSRV